ncbi:MAG TPA: hypothetical protein VFN30_13155 [Chitinophagaceae bacterium]|nr:hypothetical protein [Chitinophagaceae bacterium]
MKKFFFLLVLALPLAMFAQGNSQGKGKGKEKEKTERVKGNKEKEDKYGKSHENVIWEGTVDKNGRGPKPSKNQPAKVRSAFRADYPNATNVRWSKYRGDWTATFGNGLFVSTAVYHANGQRRDTRTPIPRTQVPGVILDDILKRKPQTKLGDIIKIEIPQSVKDVFRVKTILDGVTKFVFYNIDGKEVKYDY